MGMVWPVGGLCGGNGAGVTLAFSIGSYNFELFNYGQIQFSLSIVYTTGANCTRLLRSFQGQHQHQNKSITKRARIRNNNNNYYYYKKTLRKSNFFSNHQPKIAKKKVKKRKWNAIKMRKYFTKLKSAGLMLVTVVTWIRHTFLMENDFGDTNSCVCCIRWMVRGVQNRFSPLHKLKRIPSQVDKIFLCEKCEPNKNGSKRKENKSANNVK